MKYCPYCAEELAKPSRVCPNCKKLLDFDLVKEAYLSGKGSNVNRKLLRQKWFKEHSHILIPLITLIVGLIAGCIFSYSYAERGFLGERADYKDQVSELQTTIARKDSAISDSSDGFQEQLASQNNIIDILSRQRKILIQIINFTRRLSNNSTITPNSVDESDFFRRNVLYLNRQFEKEQEKLIETGYTSDAAVNLVTIPQILEE